MADPAAGPSVCAQDLSLAPMGLEFCFMWVVGTRVAGLWHLAVAVPNIHSTSTGLDIGAGGFSLNECFCRGPDTGIQFARSLPNQRCQQVELLGVGGGVQQTTLLAFFRNLRL